MLPCQLPAGEGAVSDFGANLGSNQPPARRGAETHIGASPDVAEGPRPDRPSSSRRLSLEGERGTQDQSGRRRGPVQRDRRAHYRITALEAEVKSTREERDKAKEVARKIHAFMGYPGDVVNKVRVYD